MNEILESKELRAARQKCREAYAKFGMSPQYDAAFEAVVALTRPGILAAERMNEFFSVDSGIHRTRLLDGRII